LSKIVVVNSVTLDGVTQAPGRPDEDRRGGFEHGGWALPYNDPVMAQAMGKGMATDGALLFGRRTYEDFASFWPFQADRVLGAGKRLFADVGPSRPLRLVDSVTTTTGVILATYQPVISR
jgi:hypothetical protein